MNLGLMAVRGARLYGLHSPLDRGKGFLTRLLFERFRSQRGHLIVAARDGRRFFADLGEPLFGELVIRGTYEPQVTALVRKVVQPGDVAIDLGANFGWYSTLLAVLVGDRGSVHCFEPVPWIHAQLCANLELNGSPAWVNTVRAAVGNAGREVDLHVFAGLTQGHSSMSTLGRSDYTAFKAPMVTLDDYVRETAMKHVDFVKCDVEGAELAVLQGAGCLLSESKPLLLIEVNTQTSAAWGYEPAAIFTELAPLGYAFGKVRNAGLMPMKDVRDYVHGDSVLCSVSEKHDARLLAAGLEVTAGGR